MARPSRPQMIRRATLLAAAVGAAVIATAGSSSGSTTAGSGAAKPQASTASAGRSLPKSGQIVFFGTSTQNPYLAEDSAGAQAQAKKYGWSYRYVESDNSQQQQDGQITQFLGSGQKPLAIILNAFSADAAAASMNAIQQAHIPLVVVDSVPPANQNSLYQMYSGPSDTVSAQTSAQLLVDEAKQKGITLKNGLEISCPQQYKGCKDRVVAFPGALKKLDPSTKVLKNFPTAGFGEANSYPVATQVIPKYKGKINFIYTANDSLGAGVVKALQQNGLTPGKNVLVVGGTCLGKATDKMAATGALAGTAVQSPRVEGELAVLLVAQYLSNGKKILPGSFNVPSGAAPSLSTPPHKINIMPNPVVRASLAAFKKTKIWGQTASQLCGYTP
jgi:ABC-type sugar transport system substrate-binding protein